MTDLIYYSITEMPDDVLKNEIYEAEKLYKECPLILARWHLQILKDELVRRQRQPDSLYVTNPDGTVELVDGIGEVKTCLLLIESFA